MANLDTIFFDHSKKRIVRRAEKRLKIGDQHVQIMVTEKTVLQGMNEDLKLLAMESIASAQDNIVNVSKLVEDTEKYKEKMSQMKETLRKK